MSVMPPKLLKRPSSARRNIKQETFSPFVSCSRLKRVQSLLKNGDVNKPDGLLVVLGIDSRCNSGAQELVSYLLFNFFDSRKVELEESGYPEEVLDDLLMLIRCDSVDVYCNPVNYLYLLPYIAHWSNLHIHCLDEEQYEDEDRAEEFKIESFVSMVHSCRSIAIPFNGIDEHKTFEPMLIEKWPIVQAFALDDIVGGGFFTMKYQVGDISSELHDVYQQLDPVAVELLVSEQLPQFEKQWRSLYDVVDLHIRNKERDLTEGWVAEPLKTYYLHGRHKKEDSIPASRQPFVLFGTNTSRSVLASARHIGIASDAAVDNTGVATGAAQHMISQAVCPQGPLFCVRTYFLNTELSLLSACPDENDNSKSELRLLRQIYAACVEAAAASIDVYCHTLNYTKAAEEARHVLLKCCNKAGAHLSKDHLNDRKLVEIVLEGVDNRNRFVPLTDARSRLLTKTVTVIVYDIPSLCDPTKTLGSVCYGDAFLTSDMHVTLTDGSESVDGSHVILTRGIPQFLSWPVGHDEQERFTILRRQIAALSASNDTPQKGLSNADVETSGKHTELLASLGKFLCKSDAATVITDTTKIYDGELSLWEKGFTYLHPHHGALILPMSQVEAINVYDGGSPSAVALLVVQYTDKARSCIPFHLQSPDGVLVLPFAPRTRFHQVFFREVLSTWRSFEQPKITTLTDLPEKFTSVHQQLQNEHQLLAAAVPMSSFKKAKVQLPTLTDFLSHFAVSSATVEPIPSSHLPAMLGKSCEPEISDSSETVVINLVSGVPGCHQGALCAALTRTSCDDTKWSLVSFDATSPSALKMALAEQQQAGNMKIIVRSSGFMDIVDVVQAILCDSNSTPSKNLTIGAVTVCVNPHNTFLTDHYTWPKLLDQCAHGWVNNIVFTDCTDMKHSKLENLQQLLRAVNSNVAFLLAENGEITRSPDINLVLSQTAFNEPSMLRARHLSRPGWWRGRYVCSQGHPVVETATILFSRPLLRNNVINEIKALSKKPRRPPFSRKFFLLSGTIRFTDSPDDWFELRASVLTGNVYLTRTQQMASPGVTFHGFRLVDHELRDWLRVCAPKKEEKKAYKTIESLTPAEIKMVHRENHLKPTPEGWFYNGSHFVSLVGDKSEKHPDLEKFLSAYLDDLNKEVELHNTNVDRMKYHDLFD